MDYTSEIASISEHDIKFDIVNCFNSDMIEETINRLQFLYNNGIKYVISTIDLSRKYHILEITNIIISKPIISEYIYYLVVFSNTILQEFSLDDFKTIEFKPSFIEYFTNISTEQFTRDQNFRYPEIILLKLNYIYFFSELNMLSNKVTDNLLRLFVSHLYQNFPEKTKSNIKNAIISQLKNKKYSLEFGIYIDRIISFYDINLLKSIKHECIDFFDSLTKKEKNIIDRIIEDDYDFIGNNDEIPLPYPEEMVKITGNDIVIIKLNDEIYIHFNIRSYAINDLDFHREKYDFRNHYDLMKNNDPELDSMPGVGKYYFENKRKKNEPYIYNCLILLNICKPFDKMCPIYQIELLRLLIVNVSENKNTSFYIEMFQNIFFLNNKIFSEFDESRFYKLFKIACRKELSITYDSAQKLSCLFEYNVIYRKQYKKYILTSLPIFIKNIKLIKDIFYGRFGCVIGHDEETGAPLYESNSKLYSNVLRLIIFYYGYTDHKCHNAMIFLKFMFDIIDEKLWNSEFKYRWILYFTRDFEIKSKSYNEIKNDIEKFYHKSKLIEFRFRLLGWRRTFIVAEDD